MAANNNQNQAMQRFFEFVFNVPGDCFCCNWSISCFLETVEHMEGDKRWRSICTVGMSLLSLLVVFLLSLALCPKYYWSEINQVVTFNSTAVTPHAIFNYSSTTFVPTTSLNASLLATANSVLQSPVNNLASDNDAAYNLTIHSDIVESIGLQLNLWHIRQCVQQRINATYYKTYVNGTTSSDSPRVLINSTITNTNTTCSIITYKQSGTTSSTEDLSLWFIVFVIALLLLGAVCVLGTHPLLDRCHSRNAMLRSSIQKLFAVAITVLCACILNWSSFVFAAVFENQVEKYQEWQEAAGITQSNLGTGMLAVNGAMLLGIIVSVIHCGAPIRSESSSSSAVSADNNSQAAAPSVAGSACQDTEQDDEKAETVSQAGGRTILLSTSQQRMLLRRIPGSGMHNMAILSNPERWFKPNPAYEARKARVPPSRDLDVAVSAQDKPADVSDDELREFDYHNLNEDDESSYSANLSMNQIRKSNPDKEVKTAALLSSETERLEPLND